MGNSRIIKSDFSKLDAFVKGLSDNKYVVRVGIFGNKNSRRGDETLTNADVGAKNEFGSPEEHIPARSFLRMPLQKKGKDILAETVKTGFKDLVRGDIKGCLVKIGIACENAIQDAFATRGFGQWAPNAPLTVALKKSDSPLIDTAQLRRAIDSKVVSK